MPADLDGELFAVEAAVTGDRDVAVKALMANPLVATYELAQPLSDALIEANREQLPRFFATA